jgi:hypothetical protein
MGYFGDGPDGDDPLRPAAGEEVVECCRCPATAPTVGYQLPEGWGTTEVDDRDGVSYPICPDCRWGRLGGYC